MQVKTRTEEIESYLTDASNFQGGHAGRLLFPESEEDVAEILKAADENGTPVTISGARTGTVGGAVPFGGDIISMEKMNKILEIDRDGKTAIVQPGVVLGDLQKETAAVGLLYPPDPTEWSCQIGGTVATNASGARSFKFGATRNFVRRIRAVLAGGDQIEIKRGVNISDAEGSVSITTLSGREIRTKGLTYVRPDVRKNVSGYFNDRPLDAIDLFIGSEGTLGVITEIELQLIEKPRSVFSGIVFFGDASNLLAFVEEAKERSFETRKVAASAAPFPASASLDAVLLEYFDANSLRFISEKFPETPIDSAGAIFFEQETTPDNEDALFEQWNGLFEKHGADLERSWFTTSENDLEKMRDFRHALPVAVNERVVRNKQRKIGTDMSVPDDAFPAFLRFYEETLSASGIEYVIFGHIGDCHLHANMLPQTSDEAEKARHIYGRCIAQAIMLGGTVSAEHGIGKLKAKYLYAMMGERYLNEMAEVKRAFDPKGILCRGNIFNENYLT